MQYHILYSMIYSLGSAPSYLMTVIWLLTICPAIITQNYYHFGIISFQPLSYMSVISCSLLINNAPLPKQYEIFLYCILYYRNIKLVPVIKMNDGKTSPFIRIYFVSSDNLYYHCSLLMSMAYLITSYTYIIII